MSKKRNRWAAKIPRRLRRLKRLDDLGELPDDIEMPEGAVRADLSQQVHNPNSYCDPPQVYIDLPFTCIDCGSKELWTAEQQKWYYEVAKGSLYATAARCRSCRKKERERKQAGGDPHPVKHLGSLCKRIRENLETSLTVAGFKFDEKQFSESKRVAWLDFARPGLLLHLMYCVVDGPCLIAVTLDELTGYAQVANVKLKPQMRTLILPEEIAEFTSIVQEYLLALPDVPDNESST